MYKFGIKIHLDVTSCMAMGLYTFPLPQVYMISSVQHGNQLVPGVSKWCSIL